MPRKAIADGRVQVQVRLPVDVLADLDQEAEERVLGRNKLVEVAVRRLLADFALERAKEHHP